MSEATTTTTPGTPLAHLHGHFYFADLHTTDVDAAAAFYGDLFGWEVTDIPGAPNRYAPATLHGRSKAALTALVPEQLDQGVEPYWFAYLYVRDIDEALARVVELGGEVLHPAIRIFDMGRMAVAVDPTGAQFGVWQDLQDGVTTVKDEHGSVFWYELHSSDIGRANEFYAQLVGWSPTPHEMGPDMTYFTYDAPEPEAMQQSAGGGMRLMSREAEQGVPSYWAVYLNCDDVDATYARALQLGATSLMEPHEIPGQGRSCWIADPQGAVLALMTPNPS
jgi:predicted enzyme related to lactoylglutathione lyase